MTRVMVFGTFDRLHAGHRDFFRQARLQGDELIVIVARDITVKQIKHRPSQESEQTRLRQVQHVHEISQAVLGSQGDKMKVIEEYKPNVICLGYDQTSFVKELKLYIKQSKVPIELIYLKPFQPEIYKSSKLNSL